MRPLRLFALLCASVAVIIVSCGRSTPGPSPSPPDGAPVLAFQELLAFVPQAWYDQHPPDIHGPAVYFLDFEVMRADLNLSDVSGSDTRSAKLPLITGISTQGLDFTPDAIDPLGATAYDKWGWDIADLSQAVFFPDQQAAILRGNFDKETIQKALSRQGFSEGVEHEWTIFHSPNQSLHFGLRSDILFVAQAVANAARLADDENSVGESLPNSHPVRLLFPYTGGAYGAVLMGSGDLLGMQNRLQSPQMQFSSLNITGTYQYGWDFLLITFQASGGVTNLSFIYHYPSIDEASKDVALVQATLTKTPSFKSPSATWGDLIQLDGVNLDGMLIVAHGKTKSNNLIGDSIYFHDEAGFLPARPIQ